MYPYQNNQQYPTPQRLSNLPADAIATMGLVGALLGGVVTAARDMRDVRAGNMERGEMVGDVVKESLGTGLATAVGTAAGGMVFRNGALALATMAIVGIGTKYLYDGVVSAARDAKKTAEAPVKATNKKA
jgi:hypothetical protein